MRQYYLLHLVIYSLRRWTSVLVLLLPQRLSTGVLCMGAYIRHSIAYELLLKCRLWRVCYEHYSLYRFQLLRLFCFLSETLLHT